MPIELLQESEEVYPEIERMTREAFWDVYKPGCDEHLMVHQLHQSPAYVSELSLIAKDSDQIVGHVLYTRAKVVNEQGKSFELLCVGPLSVRPSYQRQGIGARLMRTSIEKARSLGYRGIAIFGSPAYYGRFGFVNAEKYSIQTSWGANFDDFMALELSAGSLDEVSGRYEYDAAFEIDKTELEAFDRQFL
ncbi:N-acetyltransferase [Gorillibacterium sp. CAU 1737]|uniref:GNAT family N-acetyltransferase n=1 Tax=Gorillibacterium sp. CAU 1737 TaxID=3140362 RepID=UPI003260307C